MNVFNRKEIIESFRYLEENWNEYGTNPIDEEVIDKAIVINNILDDTWEVFPTATNSIQFEVEKENPYIEINVLKDHLEIFKLVDNIETSLSLKFWEIDLILEIFKKEEH